MNKTEVLCNGNDLAATVSAAGYLVDILAVIHLDGKDLLNITGKLGKSLFRNGPYIAKLHNADLDAVFPCKLGGLNGGANLAAVCDYGVIRIYACKGAQILPAPSRCCLARCAG